MDWIRRSSLTTRYRRPWGLKKSVEVTAFGVVLATFLIFISLGGQRSRKRLDLDQSSGCQFPAVYNFGDSNSDTGAVSATFGRLSLPNGQTFFGKPAGRYCDGRLVIDFIAEKLGLPYLSAYLDSIGTNFRHGANFAASGSTIQPAGSAILKGHVVQLLQFEQFKERTAELYTEAKNSYIISGLLRPEDFSKALYTIDTGQNDIHAGITSMREEEVQKHIPNIINEFSLAIKNLHQLGARAFWIHNTGPIGCLPFFVVNYPPKAGNSDQNGCVKSYNDLAQEFNKQLKDKIIQLRTQLDNVFITYVDIYSVKYGLISEAKKHGFSSPLGYCCGHYGDYRARCGRKSLVNGTELYGTSCKKPEEYLSWDGIHYSEAANKLVADQILDGSFSDPPIALSENDIHAGITSMREEEVQKHIPNIINEFSLAIKNLHQLGARAFWIHNTGPIGCLPFFVVNYPPKAGNSDQNGCVKSYNDLAQEFNKQLKDKIIQLRTQLDNVFITYVDIYSVKYGLISEAKKHGFSSPLGYCCGHYGDYRARCGRKSLVNGTELYGTSCKKPEEYLSWDGIHYSEAANKLVADQILDGSFSDPPIALSENDIHAGITSMREEEVQKHIPNIINEFSLAIKNLHQLGARAFWIHNTGPIGCLPFFVVNYPPKAGNSDQNGCVKSYNDLAQEFNKQLKDKIIQLRTQLDNVFITYVDIYSVKYGLISEAKKHGFSSPLGYCCGHYGDYRARCGRKSLVNGTELYGTSCKKPEEYLSWDGIHYSEAANKLVADQILDGSFSDPPIALSEACRKPV